MKIAHSLLKRCGSNGKSRFLLAIVVVYLLLLIFMVVANRTMDSVVASIPFFLFFALAPFFAFIEELFLLPISIVLICLLYFVASKLHKNKQVIFFILWIVVWEIYGAWCFSIYSGGA